MKRDLFKKMKGFQTAAIAIFSFFMFILGSVVTISYVRTSGITTIDASQIQQMRETALKQRSCDQEKSDTLAT